MPWQFWLPVAIIAWFALFFPIIRNHRRLKKLEARPTTLSIYNQTTQRWEPVKPQEIFDQDAPENSDEFVQNAISPKAVTSAQIYRETHNKLRNNEGQL